MSDNEDTFDSMEEEEEEDSLTIVDNDNQQKQASPVTTSTNNDNTKNQQEAEQQQGSSSPNKKTLDQQQQQSTTSTATTTPLKVTLKLIDPKTKDTISNTLEVPSEQQNDSSSSTTKKRRSKKNSGNEKEVDPNLPPEQQLPMKAGSSTVIELGTIEYERTSYHNERYIFPIGYKSERSYSSYLTPPEKVIYTCEILDGGEGPLFQVTASDDPDTHWTGTSPTGAWTNVIKKVNESKKNTSNLKERSFATVSGPEYFGLSNPKTGQLIELMTNSEKCENYTRKYFPLKEEKTSTSSTGVSTRRTRKKSNKEEVEEVKEEETGKRKRSTRGRKPKLLAESEEEYKEEEEEEKEKQSKKKKKKTSSTTEKKKKKQSKTKKENKENEVKSEPKEEVKEEKEIIKEERTNTPTTDENSMIDEENEEGNGILEFDDPLYSDNHSEAVLKIYQEGFPALREYEFTYYTENISIYPGQSKGIYLKFNSFTNEEISEIYKKYASSSSKIPSKQKVVNSDIISRLEQTKSDPDREKEVEEEKVIAEQTEKELSKKKPIEILNTLWELPYVYICCTYLRPILKLAIFEIDELEDALINPKENNGLLADLHVRLIKGPAIDRKSLLHLDPRSLKWHSILKNKLDALPPEYWLWQVNPLLMNTYDELSVSWRLIILRALMEWKFQTNHRVIDYSRNHYGINMLYNSIGTDETGRKYWYYGEDVGRLYIDTPPSLDKENEIGQFELKCQSTEEFEQTLEELKQRLENNAGNESLKELVDYLRDTVIVPLKQFRTEYPPISLEEKRKTREESLLEMALERENEEKEQEQQQEQIIEEFKEFTKSGKASTSKDGSNTSAVDTNAVMKTRSGRAVRNIDYSYQDEEDEEEAEEKTNKEEETESKGRSLRPRKKSSYKDDDEFVLDEEEDEEEEQEADDDDDEFQMEEEEADELEEEDESDKKRKNKNKSNNKNSGAKSTRNSNKKNNNVVTNEEVKPNQQVPLTFISNVSGVNLGLPMFTNNNTGGRAHQPQQQGMNRGMQQGNFNKQSTPIVRNNPVTNTFTLNGNNRPMNNVNNMNMNNVNNPNMQRNVQQSNMQNVLLQQQLRQQQQQLTPQQRALLQQNQINQQQYINRTNNNLQYINNMNMNNQQRMNTTPFNTLNSTNNTHNPINAQLLQQTQQTQQSQQNNNNNIDMNTFLQNIQQYVQQNQTQPIQNFQQTLLNNNNNLNNNPYFAQNQQRTNNMGGTNQQQTNQQMSTQEILNQLLQLQALQQVNQSNNNNNNSNGPQNQGQNPTSGSLFGEDDIFDFFQ
ncbi:hypothetical protein ABK040_001461 [Willaertia magna]